MTQYTHKMVNGKRLDLTPAEIAELEARDAAASNYIAPEPTKAELMAELAALTAKIQSLE